MLFCFLHSIDESRLSFIIIGLCDLIVVVEYGSVAYLVQLGDEGILNVKKDQAIELAVKNILDKY